jgi:hypothetical protein
LRTINGGRELGEKSGFAPGNSFDPLAIQQSQQFRARYEQLAAKRTTRPKFSALDQSVDAEIINA